MAEFGTDIDADLLLLDTKLKQLKNEYEQYFLGSRKREPHMLRQEVTRMVNYYCNVPVQNSRARFRFNNLRARFFSLRRLWDRTLREIEEGRYHRHLFKARLHERERQASGGERSRRSDSADQAPGQDLFESYVAARQACGQDSADVTREKLDALLEQQKARICAQYGCEEVRFRVVVEKGKAKLKASPVRG